MDDFVQAVTAFLQAVIAFLQQLPTWPVILLGAVVAFLSWRSQKSLTQAKNSIDLQNNYLSSPGILPAFYAIADLTKKMERLELLHLATADTESFTEEQQTTLKTIRTVLNALERMAIGVGKSVYDEDLLFNSYATFVTETYDGLEPFISAKQDTNPRYYANFAALAVDWKAKRDKTSKSLKRQ